MARISSEELERLKAEVSIQRLVEARGIELARHGSNLLGRCPFHEDRTPSLVVTPSKNLWHCMGACQTGGSVVDWVMKAEGVSFRHAVELLRADIANTGNSAKVATVRKLPPPVDPSADDKKLLGQVVDYYHQELKKSPEALAYLEKRGLRHPELVDRFRLGFSNRTLGLRLPMKNRQAGADIRSRLQRLGIIRESGHEHFTGSLVIPILGEGGEVLGMYGRKITPGLRPGTPLHMYLPGPHRGVFNLEALRQHKQVILCEALIDALTFWCAGFRNVTCSYGVEGFTEHHLEAFKHGGVDSVLIAYDRDDAGDRAAEVLAKRLIAEGLECWRVLFPKGMDANDYALKMQPTHKALELCIRKAEWMGAGAKKPAPAVEALSPLAAELPRAAISTSSTAQAVVIETPAAARPAAEPPAVSVPVPALPAEVAASPTPPAPKVPDIALEVKPESEELVLVLGERRYRVRGLEKNTSFEVMKVNLLCSSSKPAGDGFHVDTVDLYSARQRAAFVKQAAEELGVKEDVLKHDLGRLLLKLEELQEQRLKALLEPKEKKVSVSEADEQAALELLKSPNLLQRILEDFERCGVVGEETNKLVGYLGAISRKLEDPLAVILQSSSAAGKSSLMEAVLALVPEEDRVKYSAMTGQSLFYMGDQNLKHKVLAIVEEEGASRAAYALKLLQSEGELTIASTGKDPQTGRLVTQEYRVEGPVMIFLTTTAIALDEELLNRCIVLTVDEERAQTQAIHRLQRERQTLEGLLARREREALLKLHRNAQRILRPLLVANPFARELTFLDDRTRTRRDHTKYLTLIRTIALLHQHQRPVKTAVQDGQELQYIEVTLEDIEVANRLAHQVLGRSLDDLPPQTRRLLLAIEQMVAQACEQQQLLRRDFRFSRKDVRGFTGWGDTQLKLHLHRLEELEYLLVHKGGRGQSFVYELLYEGQGKAGEPFLMGLADVARLCGSGGNQYDEKKSGLLGEESGVGRPVVGMESAPGRAAGSRESPSQSGRLALVAADEGRNARPAGARSAPPYVNGGGAAAASAALLAPER
jgi:DNA primase